MTDSDTPKKSIVDHGHTLTRAGIASIPLVGAAGAELFNAIVAPPVARRLEEWRASVAVRLERLEKSGRIPDLEQLRENPAFISNALHAQQVAVKNHNEKKLEALRNAVLNAALPEISIDESLQQMFVGYVDEFVQEHILILQMFNDPGGWFEKHEITKPGFVMTGSLLQLIEAAIPALQGSRDFIELLTKLLSDRKLSGGGANLHTMMNSGSGIWDKRTTDFGSQFVEFITEPPSASD